MTRTWKLRVGFVCLAVICIGAVWALAIGDYVPGVTLSLIAMIGTAGFLREAQRR